MRQINACLQLVSSFSGVDLAAQQVGGHQKSRGEFFIVHTAGLDHNQTAFPIDAAGVSAVHRHQACPVDAQVRFEDFFPQVFQPVHSSPAALPHNVRSTRRSSKSAGTVWSGSDNPI